MKNSLLITLLFSSLIASADPAMPDFSGNWIGEGKETDSSPSAEEIQPCPHIEFQIIQDAKSLNIVNPGIVCGRPDSEMKYLPGPHFSISSSGLQGEDPLNGMRWTGRVVPEMQSINAQALDDSYDESFTIRKIDSTTIEYTRTLSEPGSLWILKHVGTLRRAN